MEVGGCASRLVEGADSGFRRTLERYRDVAQLRVKCRMIAAFCGTAQLLDSEEHDSAKHNLASECPGSNTSKRKDNSL